MLQLKQAILVQKHCMSLKFAICQYAHMIAMWFYSDICMRLFAQKVTIIMVMH